MSSKFLKAMNAKNLMSASNNRLTSNKNYARKLHSSAAGRKLEIQTNT